MFLPSWLTFPLFHRAPRQSNISRHQQCRRSIRSRPFLEHLEERTLLDAAFGIAPGASNPVLNSAPIFNGFLTQPISSFPNTTSVVFHAFPNGGGESALAVTSAFLSQDQSSSQSRDFAANSEGEISQLNQTTADILFAAYGFGSGAMPNAPWMPAAYNLGLANRQFDYPSQSDLGFQTAPPWSQQSGLPIQNNRPGDVGKATPLPELLLIRPPTKDHSQDPQERKDDNGRDQNERKSVPAEKQSVTGEAALDQPRSDPAAVAPARMSAPVP